LPVGALCVIDTKPHEPGLTEKQRFVLRTLADQVNAQIALRGANARQQELLDERVRIQTLLDRERDRIETELRNLNATLEERVEARSDELLAAEAQLRQSLKMEAVGQLTGGLAHDFNNLLTAILGGLELIGIRLAQGRTGDLNRFLMTARTAADRAAALTHRLLAFSRQQALDPKPILLDKLVSGMEEMIRRTLGPTISLEMVGAGGLWLARCDPNQLENALLNLCLNARDAMPDGGKLTVEAANAGLDTSAARVRGGARAIRRHVCDRYRRRHPAGHHRPRF
jgi:signal transduction histidine kinase